MSALPLAQRAARRCPRFIPLRLLLLLLLAAAGLARGLSAHAPVAAATPDQSGLQVTLSATSESPDPSNAGSVAALLVQATLANQTGQDLAGLTVRSQIPAQTHVVASWLGQPGQAPAAIQGRSVIWNNLAPANGSTLGPFAYRMTPDRDANGATIFLSAIIQMEVSWGRPAMGSAAVPALPLNGLWGEINLRRTVLPTGLTIFTQERPDTPTVALRIAARAGSRDEDDSTCGGSHWLEHAHFLGTVRRPNNQAVGHDISVVGGEFNAATGWEATNFWNLVPADKFDLAIDVLSDQMLNSTFPPDAFEREKQVVIQEIKLRADTPSIHAFDDFLGLVFKTSPLQRSPAATVCLLSLPIETILRYRAQHYVTANMAIAASGSLRHDETVAKIAKAFAGLPVGPRTVRPRISEPVEREPRRLDDGDGTGPAEIRIGWPAPGQFDSDWPAMVVVSDILGSVGRRLTQTLRDNRAVATGVDASYLDFSDAGTLMLTATTQQSQIDQVIALYLAQVQRLRDGDVSDADVEMSLRATAGQRALDQEVNLSQVRRADEEAAGTLESYDESLARLRTVTPADVQRVSQHYLDTVNYSLVILRP